MTATEELRRLLDERGVEYETDDTQVSDTEWYYVTKLRDGYSDRWIYEEPPDCDLLVSYQYDLGAEEAIAATLGWGMLTADDVRDLIERHSDASGGNGRDFHNGAYVAIADELNATLGSGTCRNVHEPPRTTTFWPTPHFKCSECGEVHVSMQYVYFCPNCGRRIVEVNE